MNLIADYSTGGWNFNVRFVRFGEIVLIDWTDEEDVYEPKITTDVAIARKVIDNISLTFGAVNIFNIYPNQQDTETESGGLWAPVQMAFLLQWTAFDLLKMTQFYGIKKRSPIEWWPPLH